MPLAHWAASFPSEHEHSIHIVYKTYAENILGSFLSEWMLVLNAYSTINLYMKHTEQLSFPSGYT